MAYADHSETSSRTVSIVIVALIHALLGYAFVTGLGMKYVKKAAEQLNVIDVKEEPPPPDEPPPPPPKPTEVPPPPVVAPPPIVQTPVQAPIIQTAPKPLPVPPIVLPPTPAPPPPRPATRATPRGVPGSWVTSDDYPSRALREERQGTVGVTLAVGTDGKPTNCTVTSSSGHSDLDAEACRLLMRRARFKAAQGSDGNAMTDSWSSRFRWQIPQ
ncbi:MAG: energy transducer TonB [Sphingobium sp.]